MPVKEVSSIHFSGTSQQDIEDRSVKVFLVVG